jgi:hypothetical protein
MQVAERLPPASFETFEMNATVLLDVAREGEICLWCFVAFPKVLVDTIAS